MNEAQTPQRVRDVYQKALDLLAAHGLHDWSFAFNRRKQSMGLCVYHRRTIELTEHEGEALWDAMTSQRVVAHR